MSRFHLIIDSQPSTRYAALVVPSETGAPQPKYYEYDDVLGRDGSVRKFEEAYSEYTNKYDFYFLEEDKYKWGDQYAKLKQWIYSFNTNLQKVTFQESTNMEWFSYVSKVEIDSTDRQVMQLGICSVNFTFEPFEYAISGMYQYDLEDVEYNSWYRCEPEYILTSGTKASSCYISIRNDESTTSFSLTLPANAETHVNVHDGMVRYYQGGDLKGLVAYNGNVKDLTLANGVNNISISGASDISVVPNWRRL